MSGAVRTYAVSVDGYGDVFYSARSPGKARARAYRDFQAVSTKSFGEFLSVSSVRCVPNPPGVGDRILVDGKPATRCLNVGSGHYVHYMRDDSDTVLCSHPLDVTTAEPRP